MAISPELLEEITRLIDGRVRDIKVQREDFDALRDAVRNLAEAQARTEQRLEILAEAQTRTEQAVRALAEAQARTEQRLDMIEERLGRLEAAVERLAEAQARTDRAVRALAEAQARTEQRLEALAEAQAKTEYGLNELSQTVKQLAKNVDNLAQQVGRLSDNVGFGLEDVARVALPGYLWRHYGIALEHELDRRFFKVDTTEVEINLYGEGKRNGEDIIVLGECKSRIYNREVEKFVEAISVLGNRLNKKIFKVMFGFYLHPSTDTPAELDDIILVASYHR